MFTIRQNQMLSFRAELKRQLILRIAGHLQTQFATETATMERAELERLADAAVEVGSRYGFVQENHLRPFAEYVFLFGPELDRREDVPWIREALEPDDQPDEKLARLDNYYIFSHQTRR